MVQARANSHSLPFSKCVPSWWETFEAEQLLSGGVNSGEAYGGTMWKQLGGDPVTPREENERCQCDHQGLHQ